MQKNSLQLFSLCALSLFSQLSYGSAFQIFEQSGAATSNAYAGLATMDDASAAFYNPAGMSFLPNPEVTFGASYGSIKIDFSGIISETNPSTNTLAGTSIPSATGNTRNVLGNLSAAIPIEGLPWGVSVGFSVTAPYAFETNYENTITTAYATRTYLQAINFNPCISFKLMDNLSVGVGANAQQLKTIFDALAGLLVFSIPVEYDLEGWAYTWNAGVMYEPYPGTFIGASYRPKLSQEVSGTLRTGSFIPSSAGISFDVQSENAKTNIQLPATTSFGFRSAFTDSLTVMGNAVYTQWDVFQEVVLHSDKPIHLIDFLFDISVPTMVTREFHFENSWLLALGANYQLNTEWTFKGGVAWDETPVQDSYREFRIPDGDRFQLAGGIHYQANPNFSVELAYQHFFVPRHQPMNNVSIAAIPLPSELFSSDISYSGKFKNSADIFAVQFTWDFV